MKRRQRWTTASDRRVMTYIVLLVALGVFVKLALDNPTALSKWLLGAIVTMIALALGIVPASIGGTDERRNNRRPGRRTPGQIVDGTVDKVVDLLQTEDDELGEGLADADPDRGSRRSRLPADHRRLWAH